MATKGIGLPWSNFEEPNEATMKRGVRENKRPVTSIVQRLSFLAPAGAWKKHTASSGSRSSPTTRPEQQCPFSEAVLGFCRISELVLPTVLAVAPRVSRSMWQQKELPVMGLQLVPKAGALLTSVRRRRGRR